MKQIYMIAIEDCKHYEGPDFYCEAYFDTEDPDLIAKVKNHLTNTMSYKGSFESFDSINKDNFESVILNLSEEYYVNTLTLE